MAELLVTEDHPFGTKRPPNDTDKYDTINRDDVTLVDVTQDWETLSFDMHLLNTAKGYDTVVGSIRMSRAQEGSMEAIGGTLHVGGGGAWAVACTKTE